MRHVWESCLEQGPRMIAQRLLQEAHEILAEDIRINRSMGEHGAALLSDGARVLTHCKARSARHRGFHGTGARGHPLGGGEWQAHQRSWPMETRPFLQGARLTAWELLQDGIPVTLITDSMAGHMMATARVDARRGGTDRVAAQR